MYTPPTVHRTVKQTIDWKIVICYLLLVLIGWVNIYAAGHSSEVGTILDFDTRSGKQFVWIITAFILATLILFVFNPRLWEVISIPTYVCVVLLLVGVIFFGVEIKGSRSWFALGPVRFQPAEISKISTSLVLATVMSRINLKHNNTRNLLMIAAIIGKDTRQRICALVAHTHSRLQDDRGYELNSYKYLTQTHPQSASRICCTARSPSPMHLPGTRAV